MELIGRDASTVSRELRRNASRGGYRPFDAHRLATARRARGHRRFPFRACVYPLGGEGQGRDHDVPPGTNPTNRSGRSALR